jgi:small subunit ribosomal protein S12e
MADEDVMMDEVEQQPEEPMVEEEDEIPLSFEEGLQEVLKKSLVHDGLARGLKEAVKALDRQEAHLCILSESCDEESYRKLVTAMCKQRNIPLVSIDDSKKLGEWAGLCRLNEHGEAVKVVSCSCVVVKSFGEQSKARIMVMEHIKTQAA